MESKSHPTYVQMSKKEYLTRLISKYAVTLILFDIVTRFCMKFILDIYFSQFPIQDMTEYNDMSNLISALVILALSLIAGLFLLSDLNSKKPLTWILFLLTLLNPYIGITLGLIWKMTDKKIGA